MTRYDVNNSVPFGSAYPGGRSAGYTPMSASRIPRRNNFAGELAAVNQGSGISVPTGMPNGPVPTNGTMGNENGAMYFGKPANWWVGFVLVFALFIVASRRFNGEEKFTNVRMSVYNGVFLTLFIVLILNLLKVIAARFPIPGLSPLILAA